MTLQDARLPSLRDKLEGQERKEEPTVPKKKKIKVGSKKVKK